MSAVKGPHHRLMIGASRAIMILHCVLCVPGGPAAVYRDAKGKGKGSEGASCSASGAPAPDGVRSSGSRSVIRNNLVSRATEMDPLIKSVPDQEDSQSLRQGLRAQTGAWPSAMGITRIS